MGYNTTIVLFNDDIDVIQDDHLFGRKMREAVLKVNSQGEQTLTSWGRSVGVVMESHHADHYVVHAVGGNTTVDLGIAWGYGDGDVKENILRDLADHLGYDLVKR